MRPLIPLAALVLLSACAATSPEASDQPSRSAAVPSTPASPEPSEPAPTPSESESESESPGGEIAVGGLVEVAVDALNVRDTPSTSGESLGTLPAGAQAYVAAGPTEADGAAWYYLASVQEPNVGDCGDPAPAPSLECNQWDGWAAATAGGETLLVSTDADCPAERTTDAYLAMAPAMRLACAGDEEWVLTAYMAPETEGRGCLPVWIVSPNWLDSSCNFTFPQPEERAFDSDSRLQVFVHPDLGACGMDRGNDTCPLDEMKGRWVELTGHLDDPTAATCEPELVKGMEEAINTRPSDEEFVMGCRLAFVVTGIQAVEG